LGGSQHEHHGRGVGRTAGRARRRRRRRARRRDQVVPAVTAALSARHPQNWGCPTCRRLPDRDLARLCEVDPSGFARLVGPEPQPGTGNTRLGRSEAGVVASALGIPTEPGIL